MEFFLLHRTGESDKKALESFPWRIPEVKENYRLILDCQVGSLFTKCRLLAFIEGTDGEQAKRYETVDGKYA